MEKLHPFKEIRIANSISQRYFAELCEVTPQTIIRTEQGLYGMPSVKVLNVLASLEDSPTKDELLALYRNWQTSHRLYNSARVKYALEIRRAVEPHTKFTIPKLSRFLECTSTVAFCKLMCVHPSQVDRYTRYGGNLHFLEEALRDIVSEDLVQWVVSHLTPS